MSINLDDYKEDYIIAALELVDNMRAILITSDFQNQPDLIETLHRDGHSLKGQALAMGYNQIGLTGKMLESVFLSVKEGKTNIDKNLRDLMLETLATIREALNKIKSGDEETNMENIISNIENKTGVKLLE